MFSHSGVLQIKLIFSNVVAAMSMLFDFGTLLESGFTGMFGGLFSFTILQIDFRDAFYIGLITAAARMVGDWLLHTMVTSPMVSAANVGRPDVMPQGLPAQSGIATGPYNV